jgi:hypothetical protein
MVVFCIACLRKDSYPFAILLFLKLQISTLQKNNFIFV